ncbi:MAG: SUMF1/EgtB/PvdO family nonheme iron enzyme [Deltaproteobacteria bacterium]|nr:SUMF1/EgtB/PvdO family nonheme iron enzyme [Deltaproteobacteria bacterium]
MRTSITFSLGLCAAVGALWAFAPTPRAGEKPGAARARAASAAPGAAASCASDQDGDGYGPGCAKGPDCNDRDAAVHPGRPEQCNGRDDNCDTLVDEGLASCAAPTIDRRSVSVPAGAFLMGSPAGVGAPDERPEHRVVVSGLRLDRHEVTNRRYEACVAAKQCTRPALLGSHRRAEYYGDPRFADYPVIFVDWHQAQAFCRFAGGRLPTEAEWEKAARGPAPSKRVYPWGDSAPDCLKANHGGPGSCVGDTDRVGRRPAGASLYGAHDLAGNVWEWTADWYAAGYYATSDTKDPQGPASGRLKVMRGGCWAAGADSLRVSCRKAELPSSWAYNVGFRCAYPERS